MIEKQCVCVQDWHVGLVVNFSSLMQVAVGCGWSRRFPEVLPSPRCYIYPSSIDRSWRVQRSRAFSTSFRLRPTHSGFGKYEEPIPDCQVLPVCFSEPCGASSDRDWNSTHFFNIYEGATVPPTPHPQSGFSRIKTKQRVRGTGIKWWPSLHPWDSTIWFICSRSIPT